MATLTYAGIQLGIPDPDGQIQKWIDRLRPIEDIFSFADPTSTIDGRDRPQGQEGHAVGLPRFNWTYRPPRYRINTLWWPCTGASRFAIGLFLTNLENAKKIQAALGPQDQSANTTQVPQDGSATLEMSDSRGSLSLQMWALPMRPLGAIGQSPYTLVLLPLVDRRYFWQWSKSGQMFLGPESTWSDLQGQITGTLGASITLPDPEGYIAPDWSGFDMWHENAAMMLDAYAATVGQRFVAGLDGSYQCQKSTQAKETLENDQSVLSAGGSFLSVPANSPGKLTVVFPRRQGGIVYQNGVCDTVTVDGPNTAVPGEATIHTTFQADYSSRSSQADNQQAMNTLAAAIARDFFAWREEQYSATVPGVGSSWTPNGFDDYLWFHFFSSPPPSKSACSEECACDPLAEDWLSHTLVESLADNFGVEENLTQASAPNAARTFRPMPIFRAQLTSDFQERESLGAIASGRLLYGDDYPPSGHLAMDGVDIFVFDTLNVRGSLKTGDQVWLSALAADTEQFELLYGSSQSAASDTIVFELFQESGGNTEPILDLSGFCAARLCILNAGTGRYDATARLIYVGDLFVNPGEWQGMAGLRGIGRKRIYQFQGFDAYDIVWMERPALFTTGKLQTGVPDNNGGFGEPDSTSLFHYQQGEKPPPNRTRVYDPQGMFPYALGPGLSISQSQEPSAGAQFVSTWDDRTSVLRFLISQQQTFYCSGFLRDNLKTTDTTGNARDIKVEMYSPFNLPARALTGDGLTFNNTLKLTGAKDSGCLLLWSESVGTWILLSIDDSFWNAGFAKIDDTIASAGNLVDVPTGQFVACSVYADVRRGTFVSSWLEFVDFEFLSNKKLIAVNGQCYAAKRVSFHTDGKPIYESTVGEQEWEAKRANDLAKGVSGEFELVNGDGSASGITVTAEARYRKFNGGKKARVKRDGNTFVAHQAEC